MHKIYSRLPGGSLRILYRNVFILDVKNRITISTSLIVMGLIVALLLMAIYWVSEIPFFYLPLIVAFSTFMYLISDYFAYYIMRHRLAMY